MDEVESEHALTPREKDRGHEGPPQKFGETNPPPYSSADYSYMEIIMAMQNTMGQLTEAVASLKEQSKTQGEKLEQVRQDVHAAKVSMRAIGGIVAAFFVFLGWMIYEIVPLLQTFLQKH